MSALRDALVIASSGLAPGGYVLLRHIAVRRERRHARSGR
jgi:hypothetical protein